MARMPKGKSDPNVVITQVTLEDAPGAHETFRSQQDECIRVVMRLNLTIEAT